MEAEHRARLEAIFAAAVDLPVEKRAGFLDRACTGDPELRRRVERLLEHDRATDLLPVPPVRFAAQDSIAHETEEPPPARIGRFPVVGRLGRGGMSVVYEAVDPESGETMALKVLPSSTRDHEAWAASIVSEARVLASLAHPGIARLRSLEHVGGRPFLVMDLVQGTTLAERIAAGPLDLATTLSVSRQIAAAIEAAHSRGVIHRDLKPQNVMLTRDGLVKLLDFGIAQEHIERPNAGSRGFGPVRIVAGTPGYMSPEQIEGVPIDARADIWAFGCMLFECLAGRRLWLSSSTDELLRDTLEGSIQIEALPVETPGELRDLLRRCLTRTLSDRLAELAEARRIIERLHEVRRIAPGAGREAGARAIEGTPPHRATSFVGRQELIAEVSRLLEHARVLTLVGIGGVGKSRLALAIAEKVVAQFTGGVAWVDLSSAAGDDPTFATGRALALRERSGQTLGEVLREYFASRHFLLVIDGCEAVTACGRWVSALVDACPSLVVLATSRERLGTAGEVVVRVQPLKLPPPASDPFHSPSKLSQSEAVELFVARAQTAVPGFAFTPANVPAVAELCRRLDGLPLAIEIATARLDDGSVEQLLAQLDDRMGKSRSVDEPMGQSRPGVFDEGMSARSLRGLVRWSHDRLSEQERILFRRLCVFSRGFTLGSAESICAFDAIPGWSVLNLLIGLRDRSLLELDHEGARRSGEARYRMLDAVHAFGREELARAGEELAVRRRHREHFLDLADTWTDRIETHGRGSIPDQMSVEYENLRAALADFAAASEGMEAALHVALALGHFWDQSGHWTEGRVVLDQLLAGSATGPFGRLHGRALLRAALLARNQADYTRSRELLQERLALERELGDRMEVALTLRELAGVTYYQADFDGTRTLVEEALAIYRELGARLQIAHCMSGLAALCRERGDLREACSLMEEVLATYREHGHDEEVALALSNLAFIAMELREFDRAEECFGESLERRRKAGDLKGLIFTLRGAACLAHERAQFDRARELFVEGLDLASHTGDLFGIIACLDDLAETYLALGEPCRTARLQGTMDALREMIGAPRSPRALEAARVRSERLIRLLGEADHRAQVAAGRALDWREAVALAVAPLGILEA